MFQPFCCSHFNLVYCGNPFPIFLDRSSGQIVDYTFLINHKTEIAITEQGKRTIFPLNIKRRKERKNKINIFFIVIKNICLGT